MSHNDLLFCEAYEKKIKELQLLTLLKKALTEKGLQTFTAIDNWVSANTDKYLNLTR